jgi:hypothetical protein
MEGGDKTFYTTGRLTSEMVIKVRADEDTDPRIEVGTHANGL